MINNKCGLTRKGVIPGEKVYVINCHINVLDNGGNLIDAIGYATFHALKHFRRPFVTVVGNVVKEYLDKEREPLPLSLHHELLFTTFGFCVTLPGDTGLSSVESNIEGGEKSTEKSAFGSVGILFAFIAPTSLRQEAQPKK